MSWPPPPPPPRCPHCGAEYFACTTDWRGICVRAPKKEN